MKGGLNILLPIKKNKSAKSLFMFFVLGLAALIYFCFFQAEPTHPPKEITLQDVEQKFGYHASKHAKHRMIQRNISAEQIYTAFEQGEKYRDETNKNEVFRYVSLNVIVSDHTIVTLFRGKIKARWKKLNE